jgi:hypothetical protein
MECGDQSAVDEPGQQFEGEERERWNGDQCDREDDDVPARRAADCEEGGVPSEDVEERLGEGEGAESAQVKPGRAKGTGRLRRPGSHGRGPAFLQRPLEGLRLVVGVRPGPFRVQKPLHHRILARRKFDQELAPELREPLEEAPQRHVAREGDVVKEGEAEDKVGSTPLLEGFPLAAAPAEARGGVGYISDEGQDVRGPFRTERAVEELGHGRVGVHREGIVGVGRGDPRVAAVVRAEVPDERPTPEPCCLPHECLLGRRIGIAVRRLLGVARPTRPVGLPVQ